MCKADNNLDGAKHKLADPKIPRAKRMKKAGKTKKQITLKKSIVVKQWSGTQTVTVEKPSAAGIKKAKKEQRVFFGLDLHKKFLQGVVVVADQKGDLLMSKRVENDFKIIEQEFSAFPKNARHALESSSVRYGIY